MPKVSISTSCGSTCMNYVICTPDNPSADKIDPSRPTVLLLHPVYFGNVIFHSQFSDVQLRRFNLVAPDMRGHGETDGQVSKTWGCKAAAEDVIAFMDALRLPPCHFFGISMGSCIALEVAMTYPERALSAFLISPLSEQESTQGRLEILNAWIDTFHGAAITPQWNPSLLEYAEFGAMQLAYNNLDSTLIEALERYNIPQAINNFGPGKFETAYTTTVKFFLDLVEPKLQQLARIKCPVMLVFCGADVAATVENCQKLQSRMREVGVDVELRNMEGAPRFGIVTHADRIDELFLDFLKTRTDAMVPAPLSAISPFHEQLRNLGWRPEEDLQSPDRSNPLLVKDIDDT